MSNRFNWPINRNLSGATTPSQSELGSDGNKAVLHIPQGSSNTAAPSSGCLMLYSGHFMDESYFSADMQSVYSTASAD